MIRAWLVLGGVVLGCGLDARGSGEGLDASAGGVGGGAVLDDGATGGFPATGGEGGSVAGAAGAGGVSGSSGASGSGGGVAGAGGTVWSGGSGGGGTGGALGRVTNGLQLLYTFREGSGSQVHDVSQVGVAHDLNIKDSGNVSWTATFLRVDTATILENSNVPAKLAEACKTSNALTVEAWLFPLNTSQGGPARIVTSSPNAAARNFTLFQEGNKYGIRIRTSTNLGHEVQSTGNTVQTQLSHLVATRSAAGQVVLYLDKAVIADATFGGTFSNWAEHRFAIANEYDSAVPRYWRGELHLVAVYCAALSAAEVAQNFDAGP